MDGDEAANHCTSICKISLRIIGIWPEPKKSEGLLTFCRVVSIFVLIFFFIIVSQTAKLITIWGDIETMSEILCKVDLPSLIILLMIYVIQKNKSALKPIVALINEDWNKPKSEGERKIMLNMAGFARKISLICLLLSQGTFNFHTAGEIYYNVIDKSSDSNNETRRLFIVSEFPFETRHSPIFELTWFSQCLATFLATVTYAGVHGFFGILIMHLCGQFAVLKFRLINVIDKIVQKTTKVDFQEEYASIVRRHQKLYRFVVIIEDTFNMLLFVEILISTIEFCLQAFQLSIILGRTKEEFPVIPLLVMIIFIAYMLAVFYVYCFVGEQLKYHSTQMVSAVYYSKWYKLQPKVAKNLLFLMQRAEKPCIISAGKFFRMSLETFNKILKTSLGYLSVLLTI